MRLTPYKKKRKLSSSLEPPALIKKKKKKGDLIFVIQEHHARSLHYDLRLEVEGVLKSWAIPKQPSSDPRIKRLAIMVEDHPFAYKDFKGTISSGYGAGTVSIWDKGTYLVEGADSERGIKKAIREGILRLILKGKRLKGRFNLIRLNRSEKKEWLLIRKQETESSEGNILTHLDKIYWPDEHITKGDLIRYYSKVAKWILPHLKNRPESLKRYPNGIKEKPFFQKNIKHYPSWVETTSIQHENKKVNYLLIQNEETLLFAANLGCIEIHPFFSRIQKLQNPDFIVFDLDPKKTSFQAVIQVAQEIHKVLEEIEVPSYCKTSGATGLHIAIPLGAHYSYKIAKQFAVLIATIVSRKIPKIATLERSLSKRSKKVHIDCFQNNFGQTLAAPYSIRALPGAPVSTPLTWSEVKKGLDPKKYTIKTIFSRLKKWGDLYAPVLGKGIRLEKALTKLQKTYKFDLYQND